MAFASGGRFPWATGAQRAGGSTRGWFDRLSVCLLRLARLQGLLRNSGLTCERPGGQETASRRQESASSSERGGRL